MTRPRLRIGSELLPVCLILASLAGTSFLVVSMHRRAAIERQSQKKRAPAPPAPPVVAAPVVRSPVQLPPTPVPPPPEPTPAPPVEDPTRTALARLGAAEADQLLEAQAADRRAKALERSTEAALAESQRWKRREQVVRSQVETITDRTRALEQEVDALALERDVLAHELEASKAALTKARTRSSFAVLPHRAPNGTWRRPIVIECRDGTATLQPRGPSFSLLDLSALLGARSSPLLLAVARELARIQGTTGPDGAPTVPYIFFIVRPDGIRPYYDARARLESLGIAFGYELVDQDMEIDFPDLDHPEEWDGSPPLPKFPDLARTKEPRSRSGVGEGRKHQSVDDFRWPTGLPRGGSGEGSEEPSGNRRLTLGGGNFSNPGRSFGDRGIAAARDGGIPALGRPDDLGRESQRSGGSRMNGAAETPGMLPPQGGTLTSPGMLPATGGGLASAGSVPGTFEPSGHSGATNTGSKPGAETQVPLGLNPPGHGRPGLRGDGARTASASPVPDDVSTLDGVSLMGRKPGEGAPFRPRGLLPGEPGAPPEAESLDMARAAERPNGGPGATPRGTGAWSGSSASSSGGTSASGGASAGGGAPGGEPGGQAGGSSQGRSRGPLRIEVPMEIVVACGPSGVVIHPGGYSLSLKLLRGKDPVFTTSLQTIVRLRQQVDPMIRPQPSIKFLVEPGGGDTYREVRRQTVLSGINWPTILQVADTRVLDFLPRERF